MEYKIMKTKIRLGKSVYSPVIRLVYTSVGSSVSNQLRTLTNNSVSRPILNSTRWRIRL
jgi:hypothetical protein